MEMHKEGYRALVLAITSPLISGYDYMQFTPLISGMHTSYNQLGRTTFFVDIYVNQ